MRHGPGDPRDHQALVRAISKAGVSARVLDAFREVDRRHFVPGDAPDPYVDRPIEILEQQTTSQPSLIAQMIEACDLLPGDKVLEVGTGFGYQTALLAKLTGDVVSVERFASISSVAASNLERAGIKGVELVIGDGWDGVSQEAPFDAIIVSAAAARVPDAFVEQLVEGGRLVIPLRAERGDEVWRYLRKGDRLLPVDLLTPARFVPLIPGKAVQSKE